MATLYTSPYGQTNQGNQLQQLTDILSKITSAPAGDMSSASIQPAYSAVQGAALGMQGGQNQFQQQTYQQNLQQAGVPGMIGQYGDMGKMFQLWLADKGMAGQFANPGGNLNPYADPNLMASANQAGSQMGSQNQADINAVANMTTGQQPTTAIAAPQAPTISGNPFLASTSDILASTQNLPTPPSLVTGEMGTQMGGVANLGNLLSSLIGAEQGTAQTATAQDMAAYTDKMNVLGSLASILGGAMSTAVQREQNPTAVLGSKAQAGSVFNDIVTQVQQAKGGNATETDVWDYINQHDQALRDQGVNVDELWALHKNIADKVGQGGYISGGKTVSKAPQTKTIGGEVMEYNPKTKAFDIPAGGSAAKDQAISMLDNYLSKWKAMSPEEKYMPDSIANMIPGLFPNKAYLNTDFFTQIEPLLRKTVVGGRITQQEMTWLKNALPKAGDSNTSAEQKIQAIKDALSGGAQGFGGSTDGTTLMTSPDGQQYNVPNAKVKEAQQHGWK